MTEEGHEQCHVVAYCDWNKIPVYHVPNGGKRNRLEAAALKREGVKPGVPDLVITVAKGKYHGLYIEMKVGDNKTTKNQDEWIELLNNNGYLAVVCYGSHAAIDVIEKYMHLKEGEAYAKM